MFAQRNLGKYAALDSVVLLQLARPEGNVLVINEELRQQDIANRVGSSRETVSRVLKDLREGGYIEIEERLPAGW